MSDLVERPNCVVCGLPYHRHNVGAITYCPIIATYCPSPTTSAPETLKRDKVSARIGDILANDPACNGRVTTTTVERLTEFVMEAERRALEPMPVAE